MFAATGLKTSGLKSKFPSGNTNCKSNISCNLPAVEPANDLRDMFVQMRKAPTPRCFSFFVLSLRGLLEKNGK